MGLSSLANAPVISKPCESRSRQDERLIDALFDDSKPGLAGIDEDAPLELPLPKLGARDEFETSISPVEKKASPPNEDRKLDEESFKKKWSESLQHSASPKLEKKNPLESFLSHAVRFDQAPKSKDDDWGETSDVLSMLPDGSDAGAGSKPLHEKVDKRLFAPKKPANEMGFEFGEYQPSCLTAGRRSPVAGRRRTSPTSVSPKLMVESNASTPDPDASLQTRATTTESQNQQSQRGRPRGQQHSPLEGLNTHDAQDTGIGGSDRGERDNSLLERLRQALVSKGLLETEKNQLGDELKRLRDENSLLKDHLLKAETDKLRVVKEMSEMEISNTSLLCNQFSEDKEEAQRIIVQLSSEVHLLKNTCILAEEKLSSLQRVYQEEVDMLKESHAREIDVKEKQLMSERSFLANQKYTVEALAELVAKSNVWAKKVDEIQSCMVVEREQSNRFRTEWMEGLERSVNQQHASISSTQKQLEEVLSTLSLAVYSIKELQNFEKENLSRERSTLMALQETMQSERGQSLAELSATKQKLEEIRSSCIQEKESFLQKCFEEKKELASERDALLRMKEQLYNADAALEKQLIEHSTRIQNETGELSKQRAELERARVMAADITQQVEDGRRELELRCQAFHNDQRPEVRNRIKPQQRRKSSESRESSGSQLLRLIQHNPWNNTVKQLGRKMKRKFELANEELMANTEALLRLQEQKSFLQEAKSNLQVNKQWSKKFWSGKQGV